MLRLLIADASEEFRLSVAEQLRGEFIICTCKEGKQALESIRVFQPDLMVLDLMMPGMDGISLLERMRQQGSGPMILATTRLLNEYIQEAAQRMEVDFLMVKPCDLWATLDRIRDMGRQLKGPDSQWESPAAQIGDLLLSLQFRPKLQGYLYLRDCILDMEQNPGQRLSKELYPKVGQGYQATSIQVERTVRSAIEKAWAVRDERLWCQILRIEGNGKKPTNAAFINAVAELLRQGQLLGILNSLEAQGLLVRRENVQNTALTGQNAVENGSRYFNTNQV